MDQQNEEVKCNASFQNQIFHPSQMFFRENIKGAHLQAIWPYGCQQTLFRRTTIIDPTKFWIHPSSISSSINRSTEPGENLKDDLLQIYARLTMFNMAVRLLKCLSYQHNNCTFIIKVLIITTNEDDDLAIGIEATW